MFLINIEAFGVLIHLIALVAVAFMTGFDHGRIYELRRKNVSINKI
jgi:hypothetical protein